MCMTVSASEKYEPLFVPPVSISLFFVIALPSTKISLKFVSLQLSFFVYWFCRPIHTQTHTHTHTHTTERWIRNRQRSKKESRSSNFHDVDGKNPKRGRSIGFDPTRDCACLPLVGRTYVGTYVLCIRTYIYMCKKIYIYIIYTFYTFVSV